MSGKGSAKSHKKTFPAEKGFQILHGAAQETAAGKDSVREIETLSAFMRFLRRFYAPRYGFCKVENQKSNENFLQNQSRDFRVEMDQAHRVFQAAEGGLNAPALSEHREGISADPDL